MVLHEPFRQLSTIKIGQTEESADPGSADNCPSSNRPGRGRQLSTIKSTRQRVDNCPPSNWPGKGCRQLSTIKSTRQRVDNCPPSNWPAEGRQLSALGSNLYML